MHRVYCQTGLPQPGQRLLITGDEASHAQVKRLEPGEMVEVLDGAGIVAVAAVEQQRIGRGRRGRRAGELALLVREVRPVPPTRPMLHVRSATPKGDRLDGMIEQLSQIGAASWGPLTTARGVVDPRATKLERLGRVAVAASKQCGRAHLLRIEAGARVELLPRLAHQGRLVVADASGDVWPRTRDELVVLAVGPEGGWTSEELAAMRAAGALVCRFGPHTMRIETAAVAAAAVILAGASAADAT